MIDTCASFIADDLVRRLVASFGKLLRVIEFIAVGVLWRPACSLSLNVCIMTTGARLWLLIISAEGRF